MKKTLFSLFLAFTTAGTIFASDTKVGNIWYNFDDATETAEVTFKGSKAGYDDRYKGSITIPEKVKYDGKEYTVTRIGKGAFYGCEKVTAVTLPNTITSIGEYAFYDCIALSKIVIPASVTSIDKDAFGLCVNLLNFEVPTTVETIGENAFCFVPNLKYTGTNTDAPWGARALNGVVVGKLVYKDASKTELLACAVSAQGKLNIPSTVTTIAEYAFLYCAGLDSLRLPNSVTAIQKLAFYECAGMVSLIVPETVTSIEDNAFYRVPNVIYEGSATGNPWGAKSINGFVEGTSVYKDENKTELLAVSSSRSKYKVLNSVKTIKANTFASDFSQLTSVTLGQVETIGDEAFKGCHVTSFVLPGTVKKIGQDAFNCSGKDLITSFVCEAATPPTCVSQPFQIYSAGKTTHRIYVPEQSLDAYKAATVWKDYKDSIFAITAETGEIGAQEIGIKQQDYTALFKWPQIDNAEAYALIIKEIKDDTEKVKFVYNFDGEGYMLLVEFGAPGLDGPRGAAQNLEANYKCWQYTVGGLEPNTKYSVTVIAEDASSQELFNKTKSFTTTKIQALESVQQSAFSNQKIIRDGQLLIEKDGKTYNAVGTVIK